MRKGFLQRFLRSTTIHYGLAFATNVARRAVNQHEVASGHTVEIRAGKSEHWLRSRLASDPELPAASTFMSETAANRAQGAFVKHNNADIDLWLADPTRPVR